MTRPIPVKITLGRYPEQASLYFDVMRKAGASIFCLFGGLVRDTDCGHLYNKTYPIKDLDMRVWMPESTFNDAVPAMLKNLEEQGAVFKDAERFNIYPRYLFDLLGHEIDLTLRPKPDALFLDQAINASVAQDRAADAPVGLSAVALDNTMQAWAMPDYVSDRDLKILTVAAHVEREDGLNYAQRLQERKYPDHRIILPD